MYFRIRHDETRGELTYLLADTDTREAVLVEQRRWHPFFAGLSRDEFLAQVAALPEAPVPARPL